MFYHLFFDSVRLFSSSRLANLMFSSWFPLPKRHLLTLEAAGLGRGGLSGSKSWSPSFPAPRKSCSRLKISALLLLEVMMFRRDLFFSNFLQYIFVFFFFAFYVGNSHLGLHELIEGKRLN